MVAALSAAETRAAEALMTRAWGEQARVRAAETIWDRSHVIRLHLDGDRSAVLKRRGEQDHDQPTGFGVELAALEYLNAMPVAVAPRLLGADTSAGIMIMEDLGPGASLADSLLAGERESAQADLVSYAEALACIHLWSMGRPGELADRQDRYAPGSRGSPRLMGAVERGKEPVLAVAASLGLPVDGVASEIDELGSLLDAPGHFGLVHGDACPDNVRFIEGGCRIFDFETSCWGAVAIDAVYLLAPFPSCWCFANLPEHLAAPAVDAYRARFEAAGIRLGQDWDACGAAALACSILTWAGGFAGVIEKDREWGTTTMRPRLLTWLRSFVRVAARAGVLPRLQALAAGLDDQLSQRWPDVAIPDYPALAQPGSVLVQIPDWWQPGL